MNLRSVQASSMFLLLPFAFTVTMQSDASAQSTALGKRVARAHATAAAQAGTTKSVGLQAITVPWAGDPNLPHQVFNGGSLMLQGTATVPAGCSLTSASWDPGDGSGPVAVSFANPRALELKHTYAGTNGQPFIATLTVTDSCGNASSDTFRVVVVDPKNLDVEINMAIDHGLWWLHKRQNLTTVSGIPAGFWANQSYSADTSSALQAFQIHGHREIGNFAEDPYAEDVARGLVYLFTQLTPVTMSVQAAGDPDSNGNGIGLNTGYENYSPYVLGQVIDAVVASGTPNAVTVSGDTTHVLGKTYAHIVQDMIDTIAWGQADTASWYRGGWRYGWNDQSADNSACQWNSIGTIGAERVFGSIVPAFVKSENLNYWIPNSQVFGTGTSSDGRFGYTDTNPIDVNGMNTTPSGVVQLIMDGVPNDSPRFDASEAYMLANWDALILNNRIYGMFAVAKAMRLATPTPVDLMAGTFDWYRSDTTTGGAMDGLARRLISIQYPEGYWYGYWVYYDLATAWAVIILSSTIVEIGPVAVCDAEPEQTAAGFPVAFDGSQSYHLDPAQKVVAWDWDFDNDGLYDASGAQVTHAFAAIGDYTVKLRVTDDKVPPLNATATCSVKVTPPPFPPNSDPGGPYTFCIGKNPPFVLDGSKSADIDGTIVSYEWDFDPQPLDLDFNDGIGVQVDVTTYFSSLAPGIYDIALRVTDDNTLQNVDFGKVIVVGPTEPCDLGGNNPPDCSGAIGVNVELWPADHKCDLIDIQALCNITDPDGDPVTIYVDAITQDEPRDAKGNHDGKTKVDAEYKGVGPLVWIRSERSTLGNGRVYHIRFTAMDDKGAFCQGVLIVSVPLVLGTPAIDDGQCCESIPPKP
ncbi:MAG: PKD domain-containing protein [Planctomycetes bacterium]|nr:PKD domain-containing protein [Planctomycetota bacterium]